MTKKYILVIILALICSNSAFAQKAGYMGKRFVINADLNTSTAWSRPNAYGHTGFFSFNYILAPSIEFIATKRIAVGGTYNYSPGMFAFRAANEKYDGYIGEGHPSESALTTDNKFTSHGVGAYAKFYLGDGNAPIGAYIKTELAWFFYDYTINSMWAISNFANQNYVNDKKGKGNLGGFKIEFGRDFLFFNRLRVSTALNIGIPFGGFKTLGFNWSEKTKIIPYLSANYKFVDDPYSTVKKVTEQDFVNSQLFCHYLVGIKIGIGFVAF
ncbi:MAG: hypothetical protein LBN95_07555 [Prevotellaceae bacterium]|jgi:hypothetical protein|nr:hypothetical protein [Prevotellaceae bacterium]